MERDQNIFQQNTVFLISTHTLTWSVTISLYDSRWNVEFQLTRSRGAWQLSLHRKDRQENFNSHAHVERDAHALSCSPVRIRFQLTRSRGAWPALSVCSFLSSSFQLTRSRGAWPSRRLQMICVFYFNSHAHVERDAFFVRVPISMEISTHTLTWSVTGFATGTNYQEAFQLTRSRGAWHNEFSNVYLNGEFQLTRSRGAWLIFLCTIKPPIFISTHTLTWSVTIYRLEFVRCKSFQLTRSRGAWQGKQGR